MVKIKILAVGKLSEKFYRDAQDEFTKRLSRYASVSVIQIEDEKAPQYASPAQQEQIICTEGERLLARLSPQDYLITLDLRGKRLDSLQFAKATQQIMLQNSSVAFAIGGSLGLSGAVLRRADLSLCLSEMTLTHNMARIFLLEQLYRAFKIQNHEPYHK